MSALARRRGSEGAPAGHVSFHDRAPPGFAAISVFFPIRKVAAITFLVYGASFLFISLWRKSWQARSLARSLFQRGYESRRSSIAKASNAMLF